MTKKIISIIDRVMKRKAVGIIYNMPKNVVAILQNRLLDEKKAIVIHGQDAFTSAMFIYRMQSILKIKHLSYNMIPTLIDSKMIMVTHADMIKSSFNKVISESFKYKIPILLLMNSDVAMPDFRKLKAYQRVFTIEQDFSKL